MDKYEQLKQLVVEAESDMVKFYKKGNKAAGTRVRTMMQRLKQLAQEIRVEIQGKKKRVQ